MSQFPLYQSVRFSYIIKCSVNIVHHHDHHHLLDDVLCPLRAANAGLYHLVQLGGHEDRLDNAGDGHAKGGPALAKLAAEDALGGRRVFSLATKLIGVIRTSSHFTQLNTHWQSVASCEHGGCDRDCLISVIA